MSVNNRTKQSESYAIIWVLAFAMVISVMNSTMFNVALPSLRQEFQLSSSQVSWVVTAYIIIYAIGSVAYGKLADMFRLKNLITFGLCCFALGSIVGFFSSNYWMVIVSRIFQSIGASVVPASSMLIPIRYISIVNRGKALGITSAGMALGTAIGPIIAGFVIGFASWRYLFLISFLIIVTIPLFRRYLINEAPSKGKADLIGGILLAASITLLLLSITGHSWSYFATTILIFVLFIIRINKTGEPFIEPTLFKNTRYTIGLIIACMVLTLNLCVPYLIPQVLSSLHHLSSINIGLVMFPGALIAALLGLVGGKIADAKGNRFVFSLAFLFQVIAYLILGIFTEAAPAVIAIILILANTGLTFAQITMANTISRTLSGKQTGVGMGIYMMGSFMAGAIGTSILGSVLDQGAQSQSVFSSIFWIMGIWIIGFAILYFSVFRKKATFV
ncbi:MFS transporter [Paenibacillus polymyxa]|uniref:MFS transporter n=1 Tax=Paenibacillus polymyxa TaxID=1406 RepID=UPI001865AEBF|nr:MFS transporter [Paenibacillus polymyxa]MBE3646873.1 MFS transporter [Paenibacillus polymyxa]